MATATLSPAPVSSKPLQSTGVSPVPSYAEAISAIMAQVAAGTKSPEVAGKLIASLAPPARPAAAPRITPVDARPYRYTVSEKGNRLLWHKNGKTGFTHSPADWADIVVLVEKGMIQAMLRDQNPPMSESYAQRLAKKQAA